MLSAAVGEGGITAAHLYIRVNVTCCRGRTIGDGWGKTGLHHQLPYTAVSHHVPGVMGARDVSRTLSHRLQNQHKLHGEPDKSQSCPAPSSFQSPWLSLHHPLAEFLKEKRKETLEEDKAPNGELCEVFPPSPSSQQLDGLAHEDKRSDPQKGLLSDAQTRHLQLHSFIPTADLIPGGCVCV